MCSANGLPSTQVWPCGPAVGGEMMRYQPSLFQEMELIAQQLEVGKAVRRFSHRHRPESGRLKIQRETSHIIWEVTQNSCEVISEFLIYLRQLIMEM